MKQATRRSAFCDHCATCECVSDILIVACSKVHDDIDEEEAVDEEVEQIAGAPGHDIDVESDTEWNLDHAVEEKQHDGERPVLARRGGGIMHAPTSTSLSAHEESSVRLPVGIDWLAECIELDQSIFDRLCQKRVVERLCSILRLLVVPLVASRVERVGG